jgi:hypothetical protein
VSYTPIDDTPDTGEVAFESDDPDENPAVLPLSGQHLPAPEIDVIPMTLDFGQVDPGAVAGDTVEVSNLGTGDLVVDLPMLTGSAEFTLDAAQFPCTIPPLGSELILVEYAPLDLVPDGAEITITSDDLDEPVVVVALLGDATPTPDIQLTPPVLQFGQVMVGNDLSLAADVANVGTADLTLGTLVVAGTAEYTLAMDPSGVVLAPGTSTTVGVTYAPVDTGADLAWLEIPSDDPDENPAILDLNGAEQPVPDIDVAPVSLDFGPIDQGSWWTETLLVSNVGGADLDVTSLALVGSTEYTLTAVNLPGVIAPGGSEVVYVMYEPVDDGADPATLEIASDDLDEPVVSVPIDGEATPYPDIDVDPMAVDFGDVVVETTVTTVVTITNVGTADLDLYSCQYSGDANFWISVNPSGALLAPGDFAELELSFHPVDVMLYSGSFDITSNDPTHTTITVNVIGGGRAPDIEVQPLTLDFGLVEIGSSLSLVAGIWNMGGADLELGTVAQYGSTEFTLDVDPSGEILAPGGLTEITVTYTPDDMSLDTGQLEIPSSDPDESSVYLQLTGQHDPIADIEVTPLQITFSNVDVNQTYTDDITVTNVGTGDLTVDMPMLSGAAEFAMNAGSFPITLGSGASRTITITYHPTDLLDDVGLVTITSDDVDEVYTTVDLLGTPTPIPDIEVLPTALNFGSVLVGTSSALTANIANVGSLDLTLGTLSVSGSSEFTMTVDPSTAVLTPGDSTVVEITYTPVDAIADVGELEIPSDDPDENPVIVSLAGADEPVPEIEVDPVTVDFGSVDLGHMDSQSVNVSNVGSASLDVSGVFLSGSTDFSWASASLPGTINPGASRTITVTYTPGDQFADGGILTIISDDADEPAVTVDLAGEPSSEPIIDASPWTVDFGDVKVDDVDTALVTIANLGGADLELYSCTAGGDPNFWISSNPAGSTIPAGTSVTMEVSFSPDAQLVYTGTVELASNDLYSPLVTVYLAGAGAVPEIDVVPVYFDFLNVEVGCSEELDVEISSVGSAPLSLQGYSFTSSPAGMTLDASDLDDHIDNDWDLDPGDSIVVTVSFAPADVDAYLGLLTVLSDDPVQPSVSVDLDGDGVPDGYTSDAFVQQGGNASDILWVVDNSCSMDDEQGYLADDFTFFYAIIGAAAVDYRIATVTTDDADFQGSPAVIQPTTPNGADEFADNCQVGTGGSGTERGLEYGYEALVAAYNGQAPNTGFWRDDAGLRVVFVSDEADQSGDWASYLSYYQAMKADPDDVIMSSICGTNGFVATSCSGPGGNANPGTGYVDATIATGGVLGSICEPDWSSVLTNLAWISVTLDDTFELSQDAIENTLIVYVDGVQQIAGWSYDAGLNAVVFDPSFVPGNGEVVQIEYGYYGAC